MRYSILFALTLSTTALIADSPLDQRVSLTDSKMKKIRKESSHPSRPSSRFVSGRPVTTGYDVSLTGEALYWKFYEGVSSDQRTYDWAPGYRIGAGWGWTDFWDVAASFARIEPNVKRSEEAAAKQFLKYSILNVEVGNSFFTSRSFYLRPHYGAQGAWIYQKGMQDNFNGGGLRFGFDSKWFVQRHWSLICNVSGSALYGFKGNLKDFLERIVPAAQTLVGLCWEANFADDKNHIALSLAYEANYWWRRNQLAQLRRGADASLYGTRFFEDLGSQGLTFDLSLFF